MIYSVTGEEKVTCYQLEFGTEKFCLTALVVIRSIQLKVDKLFSKLKFVDYITIDYS